MGECWQFESFANSLQIYVDEVLTFREKWTLCPKTMPVEHSLLSGTFSRFSSLYEFGFEAASAEEAVQQDAEGCRHWRMSKAQGTISRSAYETGF
jgi:urease accessory protein UreH